MNFLAFMFASTNLIVELGLMILILLGWEFLVAELLGCILSVFFVTMAFTGFLMEQLFDVLGIVRDLAGGMNASEQTYFELNYTFYLNLIAVALSGFLFYVYRRGLGAPGQYWDPVCGMRTDEDGPSVTHDGETYHFCSKACKRAFKETPGEFAMIDPVISGGHDHH